MFPAKTKTLKGSKHSMAFTICALGLNFRSSNVKLERTVRNILFGSFSRNIGQVTLKNDLFSLWKKNQYKINVSPYHLFNFWKANHL